MGQARPTAHSINVRVTAGQVQPGDSVTLSWNVIGANATVASVHLAGSMKDVPTMIECVLPQSSREISIAHPGMFTFRFTATFGDDMKYIQKVRVSVQQCKFEQVNTRSSSSNCRRS